MKSRKEIYDLYRKALEVNPNLTYVKELVQQEDARTKKDFSKEVDLFKENLI